MRPSCVVRCVHVAASTQVYFSRFFTIPTPTSPTYLMRYHFYRKMSSSSLYSRISVVFTFSLCICHCLSETFSHLNAIACGCRHHAFFLFIMHVGWVWERRNDLGMLCVSCWPNKLQDGNLVGQCFVFLDHYALQIYLDYFAKSYDFLNSMWGK